MFMAEVGNGDIMPESPSVSVRFFEVRVGHRRANALGSGGSVCACCGLSRIAMSGQCLFPACRAPAARPRVMACPCVAQNPSCTEPTQLVELALVRGYIQSHRQLQVLTALAAGEKGARSMYAQLRQGNAFSHASWRLLFQNLGKVVRHYMPGEAAAQHACWPGAGTHTLPAKQGRPHT